MKKSWISTKTLVNPVSPPLSGRSGGNRALLRRRLDLERDDEQLGDRVLDSRDLGHVRTLQDQSADQERSKVLHDPHVTVKPPTTGFDIEHERV